jgi:hypothetical protein
MLRKGVNYQSLVSTTNGACLHHVHIPRPYSILLAHEADADDIATHPNSDNGRIIELGTVAATTDPVLTNDK